MTSNSTMLFNQTVQELYTSLQTGLADIETENLTPIQKAKKAACWTYNIVVRLKKEMLMHQFESTEQEIHFFKHTKPSFVSLQILHHFIYKFEITRQQIGGKALSKRIRKVWDYFDEYYSKNIHFVDYMHSESNYNDASYFLRYQMDAKMHHRNFYVEADDDFSTSIDSKVSRLLAYEKITKYLQTVKNAGVGHTSVPVPKKRYWTGKKRDLIELVYAMHSQGSVDNGEAGIKELVSFFEDMFNVDLGEFYIAFAEMRVRKNGRTRFLDTLSKSLNRRMDDQEPN